VNADDFDPTLFAFSVSDTPARSQARPDGTFVLERIPPGVYGSDVRLPEGWYVVSASSGGRDVLKDGLRVGAIPAPIDVVVSYGTAQVEGVVRTESNDLVRGARIVLVTTGEPIRSKMSLPVSTEFSRWTSPGSRS
jgi:hypothetical protein